MIIGEYMNDYVSYLNEYKRVKKGKSESFTHLLNTQIDSATRLENKYLEFMSNICRFNVSTSQLSKLIYELDIIYENEIVDFLSETISSSELDDRYFLTKDNKKSANYDLSSSNIKYISILRNAEKINNTMSVDEVKNHTNKYVYIDNFVGTGKTFINIAKNIQNGSDIVLICYSIVEETFDDLIAKGFTVYYFKFANVMDDQKLNDISSELALLEGKTKKNIWYKATSIVEYGLISPNNNLNLLYNSECDEEWVPLLYRPNVKKSKANYIYGNKELCKNKLSERQKYILKGIYIEKKTKKNVSFDYTIPMKEIEKTISWFEKCDESEKIFFLSNLPR